MLDPRDASSAVQEALAAWLALQQGFAWRPADARVLLTQWPDPARALRHAGLAPLREAAFLAARARLIGCGARALPFGGPCFPAQLAELSDAPPLLLLRGDPAALAAPGVAIVGSRAASRYGLSIAQALASCFAEAGLVVISGLARGIDAAAHEATLASGGRTVAVQGCGIDRVYPASHRALADRIVATGGAIVTEFPPGAAPLAAHFPLRNRLISGLSRAVVVVEARERSGSLVTALHAAAQDREVFAVPGPLGVATSAGANRLLRDGAQVLLTADDVLQPLGLAGSARRGARPAGARARAGPEASLLRVLAEGPVTRDELCRRLGVEPGAVAIVLLELELAGLVAEDRDGRLRVLRAIPGPRRGRYAPGAS